MPHIPLNRDPVTRMTNLVEVVMNKCILSELGFVDGKPYLRGRFYTEKELSEKYPTEFKYKTVRLDSKQLEP